MNNPSVFLNIIILAVYGIIAYALLLLIEYGVFKRIGAFITKKMSKKPTVEKKEVDKPSAIDDPKVINDPTVISDPSTIDDTSAIKSPSTIDDDDDDDVLAEKKQIENMTDEQLRSQAIVMKNVSKFYGKLCAVDDISLSVER